MNSRQILKESESKYTIVRRGTIEDLERLIKGKYFEADEIKGSWIVQFESSTWLVVNTEEVKLRIGQPPSTLFAYTVGGKKTAYVGRSDWDTKLGRAIKDWEFKNQLSSQALKTFEELIDEL